MKLLNIVSVISLSNQLKVVTWAWREPQKAIGGGWSPHPSWQGAHRAGQWSFCSSRGRLQAGILRRLRQLLEIPCGYFLAMIKGRRASRDFSSASGTRAFVQTYESTDCLNLMQVSCTHPNESPSVGCFLCCFRCVGFFFYRKLGFNIVSRELCRCKPHRTSVGLGPAFTNILPFSPFCLSGRLKKQDQRGVIMP